MTKQKLLISLKLLMFLKKQAKLDQEVATNALIQKLLGIIEKLSAEHKAGADGGNLNSNNNIVEAEGEIFQNAVQGNTQNKERELQLQGENEMLQLALKDEKKLREQMELQHKTVAEQVESYSSMMEMTINYVNSQLQETESERDRLKIENEVTNQKLKYFEERAQSTEDMFQMTLEYMNTELVKAQEEKAYYETAYKEDLERSLQFTNQLTTKYFDTQKQLADLFSKVLYFSHPDENYNGNVFFVIEKFGITYLVMVKACFKGLEGETFSMVSNFALNNIIKVKKYINSSKLIEEYFLSIEPALMMMKSQQSEELEIAVCLLDSTNFEIEFSSTGFPIYSIFDGKMTAHYGGETQSSRVESRRSIGLKNKYKVDKISFNHETMLYFSSTDLKEVGSEGGLNAANLIEQIHPQTVEEQKDKLQTFCSEEMQQTDESRDLLIVGLTF